MIRVVVAEDQALVLGALAALLGAEFGITVVGQARDGEAALAAVLAEGADVLVTDIEMPRMTGLDVAVWAAAASTVTWGLRPLGMLVLVVGGCFIYPATRLLMRLDGRPAPSAPENPLQTLGAQVAVVLPASMPVLVPLLERDGAPAFFPVVLILVGAHYVPFAFLYGMRTFVLLAALLVMGGCLLVRVPAAPPAIAAWYGVVILLLWAVLGRWLADREARALG